MHTGRRLTGWISMVFATAVAAFALGGPGVAQAGVCNGDGLINLYASNCRQQPAVLSAGLLPRQSSYNRGQRLQPVRFEKAVILEVESRSAHGVRAGLVRLGVRCFRNETNLAFYFPEQEMSDYRERSEILYQVDNRQEKVLELKLAGTSNNILGVWEGYRAVPFLVEILDGGSLYLSALDKQFSEVEVEFDLEELRERIGAVRNQCSW